MPLMVKRKKSQIKLTLLLALAGLPSPAKAGKSSDLMTCSIATSTGAFEFARRGSLWPLVGATPEFARFGLIVCKPRNAAASVRLELSSHGLLSVAFFPVPPSPNPQEQGQPIDAAALAATLGLSAKLRANDWELLLAQIRAAKKLTVLLNTTVPQSGDLWVLYVATLQTSHPAKIESDIVYDAGSMEAEKLMTVSIEPSLGQAERILDALPGTSIGFITNLLGVFVGAVLSYIGFRSQQHVLTRIDEQKQFRENKAKHSSEFRDFFQGDYKDLKTLSDNVDGVRGIRNALIDKGIYSALPMPVIDQLDSICEGPSKAPNDSRLQQGLNAQYTHPYHMGPVSAVLVAGANFHDNEINVGLYPRATMRATVACPPESARAPTLT
jgi:hypothetical protein